MYKITIQKIVNKEIEKRHWQKLREPYTDEQEQLLGKEKRKDDPQYGFVEDTESQNEEEKIFEQITEDIDLKAIIAAINK